MRRSFPKAPIPSDRTLSQAGRPDDFRVLRRFDPWRHPLCTCPEKYSLSPYTGCGHSCLYCYASSYIPRFYSPRPKREFLNRLRRDLELDPRPRRVVLSTSSDPYQPLETRFHLTSKALRMLKEAGFSTMVMTKGVGYLQDLDFIDILSVTITSLDPGFSRAMEPGAPLPQKRLAEAKEASGSLPVVVRIDPLFPKSLQRALEVLEKVDFASQVVFSTLKPRPDALRRLSFLFPEIASAYKKARRLGNSLYLPLLQRFDLLLPLAERALEMGIPYSFCREGLPFPARTCDGFGLQRSEE